jgi:hypothetical protein
MRHASLINEAALERMRMITGESLVHVAMALAEQAERSNAGSGDMKMIYTEKDEPGTYQLQVIVCVVRTA